MKEKTIDGNLEVTKKEARKLLKESNNHISNNEVDSFVTLKDINKIYPNGVQAVYNFNLDIDKHDFIVLVGPSGCGKSTTLRMIAGLEDISSGYLYIDKILSNYLESKNRDISMVFQSYALYPQMTVYDNIAFPLKIRKYRKIKKDKLILKNSKVIDLLNNRFNDVKNALVGAKNIHGKKIDSIRYIARYLKIDTNSSKYLYQHVNLLIDDLDINRKNLINETIEKINKENIKLNANGVKLNENFEVVSGSLESHAIDELLRTNNEIKKVINNQFDELLKTFNIAYDPKLHQHKKVDFISEKLKISTRSADFLNKNRIVFIKNNKKDIETLLMRLDEESSKEIEKIKSEGKTINEKFEIIENNSSIKSEIKKDEILEFNTKFLKYLKNEVDDTEYSDYLVNKLNYKLLTNDEISNNINNIINKLNSEIENRKNKLSQKGITLNESDEMLKNGSPIYVKEKLTKEEIREKVFTAANILDLGPYLDRRPKELSGGQMQRVALGRAIVRNAKLFLMDEPLSNLDAKLRVVMRTEIVRLHEKIGATTIYVTHDQTEAMTMATKIVVMSKGWIQQIGKPQEVYDHPSNLFVATFIGSPAMNILKGFYNKGTITFENGFKVKLDESFIKKHDEFYQNKINECERMLQILDNTVEVESLEIVNYILNNDLNDRESILENLKIIETKLENLKKDSKKVLFDALNQVKDFVNDKESNANEIRRTLVILKNLLSNYETIDRGDIYKIYSAHEYKKEAKSSKKEIEYNGRKHEFFFEKFINKHKKNKALKDSLKVDTQSSIDFIKENLAKYKEALNSEHEVKIGIRPENIHLSNEYSKVTKSDNFTVHTDVIELMGNESLIHSSWNNIDLIAKITSGTLVKAHTDYDLSFNVAKMHVFDIVSGETIK